MKTDWSGRTVILTGATGGIGRALAAAMAQRGGDLVLCGRSRDRLEQLGRGLGPRVRELLVGDLTEAGSRSRLVERVAALEADRLLLIHNAGASQFGPLDQADDEAIDRLITLNLTVPIQLSRALLPALRRATEARIVNIGSAFGAIGFPGFSVYSAAKFGLRGFGEALTRELAGSGVLVQQVAPRATRTDFNSDRVDRLNAALGNAVDRPEWVAEQICRAIETDRRERFLGWPERFFVRLNALLPGVVGRALEKKLPVLEAHFDPEPGIHL